MSSLKIETLNEIIISSESDINKFNIFVETGTYQGETILHRKDYFDKLYTIELSEKFYNNFNNLDYDRDKITSLLGDSSKILPNILSNINENVIFWLDGHYSSQDTAQGEKDCPLTEEINSINELCPAEGMIIIDDLRLFGTNITEDWSTITKESVSEPIKNRIIKTFEYGDRFVIIFK